jgi:hypothetical protein
VELSVTLLTIFQAKSRLARHAGRLFRHCAGNRGFRLHLPRSLKFYALLLLCLPTSLPAAITLHSSTDIATAGYFQLRWQTEQSTGPFVLEESPTADFSRARVLYRGPDLASVISGKTDNDYFYRVTEQANPAHMSNTVKVTVSHHPLRNAFGFFSLGAVVFLATLVLVLRGNRQGQ